MCVVFWVATSCGLAGGYQRFGGTCCLNLQGHLLLGTLVTTYKTHGLTTKNTAIDRDLKFTEFT
jgi:hypothetical protein